ncbi:MAG: cytochrome c oxidase subunit II, partial [Candidatus Dormibacteria bacterium]
MQFVFGWVFWASIALGVLVGGALLYAMLRFRRRDDEEPVQFHGNTKLELTWTAIPFIILVTLFGITLANMGFIDKAPDKAMQVHVTGKQFSWTFEYTGKHARTSGKDVRSVTTLKIPADTPVALDLTSPDVNHSFYVPSLAG